MTGSEASILSHAPKHRPSRRLVLAAALIGAAVAVASFMVDWSPTANSDMQSATSAQHSRLPQLHMRF